MKVKQKIVQQMAEMYGLFIRQDSPVLLAQNFGNQKSPTKEQRKDFLSSLAISETEFGSNIDIDRLPTLSEPDFSGTLDSPMCVYVTKAVDISQPESKKEDESDEEIDEKFDSSYLSNSLVQSEKTNKYTQKANRENRMI